MLEIHTLGPVGTNCEKAAKFYLEKNHHSLETSLIILHNTLEEAVEEVLTSKNDSLLLGCVVYPELHNLVFGNIDKLKMIDCFVEDTFNMVMAVKEEKEQYLSPVSHPAPEYLLKESSLIGDGAKISLCNSNSVAAKLCADGIHDVCITTEASAKEFALKVVCDFGPVPMGFSIHGKSNKGGSL